MLEITVDDSALRSYLQQIQRKLGNLSQPMNDIGRAMETAVKRRFRTETDPDGNKWEPWALSTFENYPWRGTPSAKKYGTGEARILQRYGEMFRSTYYESDNSSVRVGFDAVSSGKDPYPYPMVHEFGNEDGNLPQRKILTSDPDTGKLADDDERYILDILQGYIDEVVDSK